MTGDGGVADDATLRSRYPIPGAHPLLGRRVPDADISTRGPGRRVFELLRAARPVLLDMSGTADLTDAAAGWTDRIDIVAADCPSQMWEVPGTGTISTPAALLIRPDGHVAWASDCDPDLVALHEALDTWCGPASSQLSADGQGGRELASVRRGC